MILDIAAGVSLSSTQTRVPAFATVGAYAVPLLGLAMVGVQAGALLAQCGDVLHLNILLTLLQGTLYLVAVGLLLRGAPAPFGVIVGIAIALRLMLLFASPFHSTDVFRYVWDGVVQGAGINPYLHIPNDPALATLRDAAIWPRINRADYAPTIYPPAAQLLFFLLTRFSASVIGLKLGWLAFEALTSWIVVRLLAKVGLPRERLLIYAWSPLAVWEIAGAGHVDAAMTAFVLLAIILRLGGRDGLAGVAVGAAVLVKFLPLVILPALWRRWDWRLPCCFVATVILGYVPYLGAGAKVLGFLPSYAREEGLSDGSGFWLAHVLKSLTGFSLPVIAFLAGAAIVLGCLALVVMTAVDEAARPIKGSLALASVAMLALSPVYPWYFLWLVPLLCFSASPPLLWITAAGVLLYWDDARTTTWMADLLYGGACCIAVGGLVLHLTRDRQRHAE